MKKIASVIGISMISMAVSLAPALAQQTKPPEPTTSAPAAAAQPKIDEKAAQAVKSEKDLVAKPGAEVKDSKVTSTPQAKPGSEVKDSKVTSTPQAKPGSDVKAPTTAVKPSAAVEEKTSGKPGCDTKVRHHSGRTHKMLKGEKSAHLHHGKHANMKGGDGKSGNGVNKDGREPAATPPVVK